MTRPSLCHIPLAALLLACPTLAAPDAHEPHAGQHEHSGHEHADHDAHEGHQHEGHDHADHAKEGHQHGKHETCSAHDHAGHAPNDPAAGEHKHEEHKHEEHGGHEHKHTGHKHGAESSCSGHDHGEEKHTHSASVPCTGDDHDHGTDMPEAIIVTADPHSRHLIAMQVEVVPEPTGALASSLYGTLTAPEHALQTYATPVAGHITLHVKSAQKVQEGDILYSIESPAFTDQGAALREGEAALARCDDEISTLSARIERLNAIGTRNSDLENQLNFKRAEKRQLEHALEMQRRRVRMLARGAEYAKTEDGLTYLIIKATKAGTVRNVGVLQGSWCEQGAPIITISDPTDLEITASLYANDMPDFNRVRAYIPRGSENLTVEGSWRLAEQVDPQTQTRALYFTPNGLPAGARPGQLCRLDLYNDSAACGDTVSIPDSAIVRVGMDDMVFIELEAGRYAALKVHAGESRRGMTPVSGLRPGQRMVVKGGYELKYILPGDGQKKKAGHFHADGKFHEGEH